jgi:ankyrin repeat protein
MYSERKATVMGLLGSLKGKKRATTAPRGSAVNEIIDPDRSGSTKLHLACSHGDVAQVRQLLAQGADVNIPNKWGAMPLDLVYSNDDVRTHAVYAEIAALLKARGATAAKWKGPRF